MRQTYRYLVAAIGLAALLVGVAGDLILLIRVLVGAQFVGGGCGSGHRGAPRPINMVALIVLVALGLGLGLLSCITPMFLGIMRGF